MEGGHAAVNLEAHTASIAPWKAEAEPCEEESFGWYRWYVSRAEI